MDFKQALKGVHLTTHLTNSNQKTNNSAHLNRTHQGKTDLVASW
jgi:hypothetical protein